MEGGKARVESHSRIDQGGGDVVRRVPSWATTLLGWMASFILAMDYPQRFARHAIIAGWTEGVRKKHPQGRLEPTPSTNWTSALTTLPTFPSFTVYIFHKSPTSLEEEEEAEAPAAHIFALKSLGTATRWRSRHFLENFGMSTNYR